MTKEIRRFLAVYEKNLQSTQRGAILSPSPKTKGRLLTLIRMQKGVAKNLDKLIKLFWSLKANQRKALLRPYLRALNTTKFVMDDVFLEARFEARHNNDQTRLTEINATYQTVIIEWIKGSPLLNPQTNKKNGDFIPKIKNNLRQPYLRGLKISEAFINVSDFCGLAPLPKRARQAILADIKRFKTSKFKKGFRLETEHLIGLIFMKAQLEIKLRWEIDITNYSGVEGWYKNAGQAIDVIRNDVIDVVGLEIRKSLINKDRETALHLLKLFKGYKRTLANLYSIRGFEAGVLFTFFSKLNKAGKFAFEDEVVGVNKVTEKISAYVGRPDPDNQDRAALSVDAVLARLNELQGQEITAFGLLRGRNLTSETTKKRIKLSQVDLSGFQGPTKNRRVVVKGELNLNRSSPKIIDPTLKPNSFAYVTNVGFPIRFEQEDLSRPLELTPHWRKAGVGIKEEARLELEGKSIPDTIAGQQEVIINLLQHKEIIAAFDGVFKKSKKQSKKSKTDWKDNHAVNLNDREIRTLAWEVLFRKFLKQNKNKAFESLLGVMNQYLKYYTRHTYFNVRDSGRNYLVSDWPTDLMGSEFFDCGVYALRTAYDIHKAVQPASINVEFRFLTFLNHISLIGYFDNNSFLVNNDRIHPPEPVKKSNSKANAKLDAGFNWAINAFSTVYDVRFIIFVAVMPVGSIQSSDRLFENKLWKMYKDSLWWGLANHRATPTSKTPSYYDEIKLFNLGSIRLNRLLQKIREKNPAPSSKQMQEATNLAVALYDLADRVADPANFVAEKKTVNFIPAIGFGSPLALRNNQRSGLPMYVMVDILKKKQNLSTKQKQLIGKKVRQAHVKDLTADFALKKSP